MPHMIARYRQTYENALHALPVMEQGDGLGWDQVASRWRIYSLLEGTPNLAPELIRAKEHYMAVSSTGVLILRALDTYKSMH